MKRYRALSGLVEAMRNGEIPSEVISPGAAATALGISRQSLHSLLRHNSLRCWCAERVILVSALDVKNRQRKKQGIPEGQRELDIAA